MNPVLERSCYDSRRHEMRFLVVTVLVLLVASVLWHGVRSAVVYRVACSSIGCPGRISLIAATLRQRTPQFPDADPQPWNYSFAKPDWIAWSSVRENIPLGDGSMLPKWQVTVADHNLTVKGVVDSDRLSFLPPADRDGDGLCEVVVEIGPAQNDAQQDLVWWVVLRLGNEYNEIVWIGLMDESIWHSRRIRPRPIWRDEDGDGQDEFVFITVETARTPAGGIVFKPSQRIAAFEWTSPGGILRTRSLQDDSGILLWVPEGDVPMPVDQKTDLDPLVRKLLPASIVPLQ